MALRSRPWRLPSSSGASMMGLSAVTTEQQTGEGVRERLLLHWVNSLPLTKCLLVEELRDLRFGDVLHEILTWLLDFAEAEPSCSGEATEGDEFGTDAIARRLRRVVQFVARECRSQDEDAMYLVNDADCVDRVMAGDSDDICAVLTVLKRLSIQRLREHRARESEKVARRRRRAQDEMLQHSLQQKSLPRALTSVEAGPKQKNKRTNPTSSGPRRRVRKNDTTIPKTVEKIDSSGVKLRKKKLNAATKRRVDKPSSTTALKSVNDVNASLVTGNGLRVFEKLDPTAKHHPRRDPLEVNDSNEMREDDLLAAHFCSWAQHFLQIEMPLQQIFARQGSKWNLHPPRKVKQVFVSGVLLCRIAAGIIQLCGKQLQERIPERKMPRFDDLASVVDPGTPSERQRNLALAQAVFRDVGVSSGALVSLESLQQPGKVSPQSIWEALDEVFRKVSQLFHTTAASSIQDMVDTSAGNTRDDSKAVVHRVKDSVRTSPKQVPRRRKKPAEGDAGLTGCAPLKRNMPYITGEQMHVVNEWLLGLGFDTTKVGFLCSTEMNELAVVIHVLLHGEGCRSWRAARSDAQRGSALVAPVVCCIVPMLELTLLFLYQRHSTLLVQVLKTASFPFCKTPRTLTEMRENISKAFGKLGDLQHEPIPQCYFTSSAEQAVLIGDRQVGYGLLWHIWQASCALRNLAKTPKSCELLPTDRLETRKAEKVELGETPVTPVTSSPLLLDIPAFALAGQIKLAVKDDEGTSFQVNLHDTFARRLAWSENNLHGDEDGDDVFPVPKAPFSSPVYSDDLSSVPAETHEDEMKYQIVDDIVPALPRKSSHESFGQDLDEGPAPSIAIAELSGESWLTSVHKVVPPVAASSNPGKTASQGSKTVVLAMLSPAKPTDSQAKQDAALLREPVEDVLSWLKRLGVCLKNPSAFHDSSALLTEFQSGVLLCCIVEKVELMRSIPGVTRPTGKQLLSKASSLHNITKALSILQQKKAMPLHLLRRATAIYAGNRDVILQLLVQIRKAYGHHHARRQAKPLSSAA